MRWFRKFFKRRPQLKYTFLCKRCDIFFDRIGFYNRCPICGGYAEVHKTEPIREEK